MKSELTRTSLHDALSAAGEGHHDYEINILKGKRDENWSGWYAAYVLGRLGNFISPSTLSLWLEDAPNEVNWSDSAALYIMQQLKQ